MSKYTPGTTLTRRVRATIAVLMTTTLVAGGTAVWSFTRAEAAAATPAPLTLAKSTVAKPAGFAALAKKVRHAVVNIATTAVTDNGPSVQQQMPDFPPGSPFGEMFRKFFEGQLGDQGGSARPTRSARASSSIRPVTSSPTTT